MVWQLDDRELAVRGLGEGKLRDELPGEAEVAAGKSTLTSRLAGGPPVQRAALGEAEIAPGKVTRTSRLSGRPVQRAALDGAPVEREGAQEIADGGVRDASGTLPFIDSIARSFGRHDVSDVRVAVGGAATDASRALGARAYATGTTIAFAEAPDLRLAAHEAAHVVQQRAGVQLDGGMDRGDDLYERHADQVADLVVRGESAEALLDQHVGAGGGGVQRAVQRFSPDQSAEDRALEARRVLRDLEPKGAEGRTRAMARWSLAYFDELLRAISAEDRRRHPVVIAAIEEARTRRATPRGRGRGRGRGTAGDGGGEATTAPAEAATGAEPAGPATADAPAAPVDDATAWDRFATAFLELPPDVRALFPDPPTAEGLAAIFTPAQRDKITAFVASQVIPDRLFNGGDVARAPAQSQAATARQRILIAGHIMTTGTYANPAQEQQRVEARMCGHFVSLINAYAGVGDASAHDVRGTTDYRGDIVLFTGTSGHATAFEGDYFAVERFDEIQPGDWLYIQGVSETGQTQNHSVVFGGWEDTAPSPVEGATPAMNARSAITYDQRHNGRGEGGIRHESTRLGERPSYRPYVWGVTRVQPPEETNIATTAEDLLPPGADLDGAAARNAAGLEASSIGMPVAIEHVRQANAAMIATIGAPRAGGDHASRLSPEQRALLEEGNRATDLEHLIHLNERLQRLEDSVRALEASDAAGARAYSSSAIGNEDTRAAGGYYTTAGRIAKSQFDNNDSSRSTGLLEHVRPPLDGYRPARSAGRRRSRRGGGGGA